MLALKELLHSKLKFGLIALAIGLVVSLTMLMAAMSEGLVSGMTGAKRALLADALVFQGDTHLSLERSLLTPTELERIRTTPGVAEMYPVGHAMASVDSTEGSFDARILGLGGRFDQLPMVQGDSAGLGPGQAIIDETAASDGISVGDTVRLSPLDRELTIVGFTTGRRYIMSPTLYVDMATWEDLYLAGVLAAASAGNTADTPAAGGTLTVDDGFAGSASIAAVTLAGGDDEAEVAALADALGADFEVATPEEASLAGNGMGVMVLAVNGIQAVSLIIGALVIGVFFYITTLHKSAQLAAIKALGASGWYLSRQLLLQITVLVGVAAVIGVALALAAGSAMPPAMAFDPQPGSWALSLVAVFVTAYAGSLFSLRAILRIDPAMALDRGEH